MPAVDRGEVPPSASVAPVEPPTQAELAALFKLKYGASGTYGWSPAMRDRFGYFNPDDRYEALLEKLITPETRWLDAGCGRDLFPSNRRLAEMLSERCSLLVGVDPDDTIQENPFVHEKAQCLLDDYQSSHQFDLVSLRMVAEHVEAPAQLVTTLDRCVAPGGCVVIYTVNKYAPVPIVTALVPFSLHHPIKAFLWRSEEKDTFPTCFRMNTRSDLAKIMGEGGFDEVLFQYLDDCRSLGRFRFTQYCELTLCSLLNSVGLRYPETCLLGVYRKAR